MGYKFDKLKEIARQFNIDGEIISISPLNGGFINSSYKITTKGDSPDYVLQKKNKNIFKDIPMMVSNILKITDFIREKITKTGGNADNEVMKIIFTKSGLPYYIDSQLDYWVVSKFIPDTITFESSKDPSLARKGGEGIGKFLRLLSDFDMQLYPTIEGFHKLDFRFRQWDKSLEKDLASRAINVKDEIDWIEKKRPQMENFWRLVSSGVLPERVTHNDTKLSNILFDKEGNVQCIIDLDTVMSNTSLADFGDAIRSFANAGEEDDKNLDNVQFDLNLFKEYTKGYLSEAGSILTDSEWEYLYFAPLYITFEQALRFLMDYIDGDIYYAVSYPDHNLVRTRAQMKLFESMEDNIPLIKNFINEIRNNIYEN